MAPSLAAQCLLVFFVATFCYLHTCNGGFVFDDNEAILSNDDVSISTPLEQVFYNDFWGNPITSKTSHKSYRPLTVLTYRLNYWWSGGLDPFSFHVLNVLLHGVASSLYLLVCACIVGGTGVPLMAAILFAVHPIHSEAVAGVVGRADLCAAVLCFGVFICFVKCCSSSARLQWIWLIMCAVLSVCSMLCKEQGITIIGVCVVYDIIMYCAVELKCLLHKGYLMSKSDRLWSMLCRQGVLLTCAVCAVAVRYHIMGTGMPSFQPVDNPASFADSMVNRFLTHHYIYSINAWLLLCPHWLCFDWSMGCVPLLESVWDQRSVFVIVFLITAVATLVYCTLCGSVENRRIFTMCTAWMVVPFIPSSNLFFRVGFVIAERSLYLPSAGFCLLVATGLHRLYSTNTYRMLLYTSVILLLTSFTAKSLHRGGQWLREEDLFTSGLTVCPLNAKVHYNIGKVMADCGNNEAAELFYREAVRLYPSYDQALNNLGNLLKDTGRTGEAEVMLRRALDANPNFAAAWMNLGIVLASQHKYLEAEQSYHNALKHRRVYPDAHYNLGNLYLEMKNYDVAAASFRAAISQKRGHSNAWNNLALLYENIGQLVTAGDVWREAIEAIPSVSTFYYSLGSLLGRMDHYEDAESYLKMAINIDPHVSIYHGNLGVLYHRMGRYQLAERSYSNALGRDPHNQSAKQNLQKLTSKLGKPHKTQV